MQWPGMRSDITPVGDGIELAVNVSYQIEGELQRRPGLTDRKNLVSHLYGAVTHQEAGHFFVVVGAQKLVGFDLDDDSQTDLYTLGYDYDGACFANAGGQLYYSDGISPMLVIARGDVAALNAGIAGPVAAPSGTSPSSGSIDAGDHLVRYRYKNAETGYVSNPSPPLRFTAAGSQNLPLTLVASSDSKVTNIIVEMTVAEGSAFFVAAIVTNTTSATIDIDDDTLANQQSANIYAAPDGYGHDQPPIASLLVEHRGRLFAWGSKTLTGATASITMGDEDVDLGADADQGHAYVGRTIRFNNDNAVYTIISGIGSAVVLNIPYAGSTDNPADFVITDPGADSMWWSRALYPEGWNLADWTRPILQQYNGDVPTALVPFYNDLYCCGQRTIRRMVYEVDPSLAQVFTVSTSLGAFNQQCITKADAAAFGFGMAGIWMLTSVNPKKISKPIDRYLVGFMDETQSADFFAFYDESEEVAWFAFVRVGETGCRWAACYDTVHQKWMLRRFRNVIRAGFSYGDVLLAEAVYIATADGAGFTWTLTAGTFDGLPSGMVSGSVTTDTGSTTTNIVIQESLGDVVGAMAYFPDTGVERVITASGVNDITVAAITAPAAGVPVYIGSIPIEVIPFWDLYEARLANKIRPSRLEFEHRTDGTVPTGLANVYLDFSTTAFTFGELFNGETQDSGISSYDDTTKALDLSVLLVSVPCPSEWSRAIRWRFTQEEPEGSLHLLSVGFFGDKADVQKDVTA